MSKTADIRIVDASGGSDDAPELRAHHDRMFEQATGDNPELYGSADDWSVIKRAGHFRRMALLDAKHLPDIANQTAVDFGTGPWGFGCVFPKLRAAKFCIGMDVSLQALRLAAEKDVDIADRSKYYTSDGETLPLDDDSVDVFWAGEVIEHVREPRRFMQEIARVCRDGARVFLSTPNRDAIYFNARGETNTIGPEHIALMNHAELRACVGTFLTDVRIEGYETSLHPAVDPLIEDEASAELAQDRALAFPQAASGLLVEGTVSKKLYEANRRVWMMIERLWSVADGAEGARAMPLFGGVNGGEIAAGGSFTYFVSANKLILLFWSHDWSGVARIEFGDQVREVDLYSREAGFHREEFTLPSAKDMRLKISPAGRKNANSKSEQVIFFKLIEYRIY